MTNYIQPIKLHVHRQRQSEKGSIVGTYADGHTRCFGNFKTERGAKSILSQCAKKFELTKSQDGMSAL